MIFELSQPNWRPATFKNSYIGNTNKFGTKRTVSLSRTTYNHIWGILMKLWWLKTPKTTILVTYRVHFLAYFWSSNSTARSQRLDFGTKRQISMSRIRINYFRVNRTTISDHKNQKTSFFGHFWPPRTARHILTTKFPTIIRKYRSKSFFSYSSMSLPTF